MKWKATVKLEKNDGLWLCLGHKKKKIADEDTAIAELIENGVTEDDELLKAVSEKYEGDDISSGFRLAQFVEDYADFIAEAKKARIIT
ncbi:MAG: hypothetical protein K6F99_04875 [Lachnospiraceae bacterium]|nr:hypothetical protein [Lachnospiraceae bacterium]